MTTTTIRKPFTKDQVLGRCPGWIAKGLGWEAVAELLPVGCRPLGMSDEYLRRALEVIAPAMEVAESVSNPRMTQSHKDFVNYERRAQEEAHVYAARCKHIESAYPDQTIRVAKRAELDAGKDKYRKMADESAAAWQLIQQRRIQLDTAAAEFPSAFCDFIPWQPA